VAPADKGRGVSGDTLFDHPAARATDPETSHMAAGRALSRKASDQRLVLAIHAANPDGLTDFELAEIADRAQTSLGVRRGELRDHGLIVNSGLRRPSPSGSPSIVWWLTEAGLRAALEVAS
jgi:hypothetical protein